MTDLKSEFDSLRIGMREARARREGGLALVAACAVLALVSLVPARPAPPSSAAPAVFPDAYANVPLTAKAAVVYDLTDGVALFSKNGATQLPLASLTKLLTVYAAIHELGLQTPITLTRADIATEGHSGLSAGETFALGDLARLSLVGSLNDGAAALARAAAERADRPRANFLSAAAADANLSQTYAVDGSGLDLSKFVSGGYGSPLDVAKLAGKLLAEAPLIALATTESSLRVRSQAGVMHAVLNTNPYVSHIPGILLSKTGYTDLAGGNLAVVVDVGMNHPVAIVALGSTETDRFTDVNTLAAATFAHFATSARAKQH